MAENSTQPVLSESTPSDISAPSHLTSEDITLVVQGAAIPCNKSLLTAASPYFDAMFRGDFAEAHACAVPIHDVTASSIQAIVNHLKGRSFDWGAVDPMDILYTASVLQLDEIQSACVQFISDCLNTQICLCVMFRAEQLGLHSLYDCAYLMSQWAFETIIESDSFRNLSYDQLNRYLDGSLRMSSEYKMFEAICTWIKQEEQERKTYMKDLLLHIDYSQLCFTEVQTMLRHPFLQDNYPQYLFNFVPTLIQKCVSHLQYFSSSVWDRAVKYFRKRDENILKTPLPLIGNRPRNVPTKVYLVATGIHNETNDFYPAANTKLLYLDQASYMQCKLYYLDPVSRVLKLSSLNNHLEQSGEIGIVVKLFPVESEVWVVSNKEEKVGKPVFSFWKFNTVSKKWVHVTELPSHVRDYIDWLVYVNNHIYILYEPFHQITAQVMDVYNVVKKQWTQISLPHDEDMKNLDKDKSMFFNYESHLYIIASWFHTGISLQVSPETSDSNTNEWKRINWCSYEHSEQHKILHCVVDRADIYALSFTGLFKMEVQGENVLCCDYLSEYMYGDMHNAHDICFRLFSKKTQVVDGRIYCWRKAEMGHLTLYDVKTRIQNEVDLQYETEGGSLETRWHGFVIVLDSCFVLPERVD